MDLDILSQRQRRLALLDAYGALLTEHQRRLLQLHLAQDWSLSEMASHLGVSRAAVHDGIQRSIEAMEGYERALRLLERGAERSLALHRLRREMASLGRRLARLEARLEGL